jgi:hypothetical protein
MAEGFSLFARWRRWVIVPALAWGGILAGLLIPFQPPFLSLGDIGCFLASVAIGIIAFMRQKKDLVSLFIPVIAVFIFIFPLEQKPGLAFQIVYAISLTALVIRLEKYFPE